MSRVRAAAWAASIGVLSVVLAATFFRAAGAPGGAVFVALLILGVALLSMLAGLFAELPPLAGLGAGAFAALLVAVVLGITIALAPLAPGAERPTWRDLFWMPLLALLAFACACAAAGYAGLRSGLRLAQRLTRSRPPR